MAKKRVNPTKQTLRDFSSNKNLKPVTDDEGSKPKVGSTKSDSMIDFKFTKEYEGKIDKYNENITKHSDMYGKNVVPTQDILVRCYLKNTVYIGGIAHPPKSLVQLPTQSGYGSIAEVESPYPYSTKAVIVAVPGDYAPFGLKPGDVVQLGMGAVVSVPAGKGTNSTVLVPTSYLHPDSGLDIVPQDPLSEHYGYLMISADSIKAKLNG